MKNILIALAIAALLLSSCSILPNRDFNAAQSRWQNSNISHYRYNLNVGCFCGFTDRMPLSIEVSNGSVRSIAYNDGTPVPSEQLQYFERYSTIDSLFNFTGETLRKADEVHASYDPIYGFPSSVQIDFYKNAVDDELALTITGFQPLP